MAQRRMFSPQIVDSDAFLDMSASAQSLYFHLGMRADDDGFVGNPKKILRMVGGNDDDLKLLLAKRFILTFQSGVIVIKHWRINNLIRKDWYKGTIYIEEKNQLKIKDNGSYTELVNENVPKLVQVRPRRLGKVRLGKVIESVPAGTLAQPFNWDSYLKAMEDDKREGVQLIAYFFRERKISFGSKEQAQEAIIRHAKAANNVIKFPKEKVLAAFEKCKDKHSDVDWSLETVLKKLTN